LAELWDGVATRALGEKRRLADGGGELNKRRCRCRCETRVSLACKRLLCLRNRRLTVDAQRHVWAADSRLRQAMSALSYSTEHTAPEHDSLQHSQVALALCPSWMQMQRLHSCCLLASTCVHLYLNSNLNLYFRPALLSRVVAG